MHAIITCGLYIYYPILEDHFIVIKEFLSENSVLTLVCRIDVYLGQNKRVGGKMLRKH